MAAGIDHVVIAVPDPDAAATELGETLGLAFTGGGRHRDAGTFNRIAFAGDSFLELIGVDDRRLATQNAIGAAAVRALERGGGLATYALVDDEIDVTVASLRAAGSSIGPVERGTRERTDGDEVAWWRAAFDELGPGRPPFLIRHDLTAAEWRPDDRAQRARYVHPIGSPAVLVRLDIATPDPRALAATYTRELGLELWSVADLTVCSVGRQTLRLVPEREMPVPAAVVIGAEVSAPRTLEALGMRFDVEPVGIDLPVG